MIRKKKDSDHKMQRQPLPDKNQAEVLLCQSSETLSALIAASPLAIIALDQSANVLVWNPAAEHLFGWKETSFIKM